MTDLPGAILLGLRFGLAICLYAFLYWALRTLWRSLETSSAKADAFPALTLMISDKKESRSITLTNAENLVGRSDECSIQFVNTTVSNHHARIYYAKTQWWIEDMGSSNGTFLNGVEVVQPAVLADQDHLSLGSLTGIIEIPIQPTKN